MSIEGGGLGGREQSWELCGTQAHEPLVVGIRGSKVARDISEEAQALLVLQCWQEMPGLWIQLVPEHVETWSLYHPCSPGLLQVKEGSGRIPRAPGLPPSPGPGHGHFRLWLLILIPTLPTPVLDFLRGHPPLTPDSGSEGVPALGHQGSDLALPI